MKKYLKDMAEGFTHETKSFGVAEVVKYFDKNNVKIRFVDTGYTTNVFPNLLRLGMVKDKLKPSVCGVGFIGDGIYSAKVNGKNTNQYQTWNNMFKRCYHEETQRKQPTYIGCTVHPDWHNFQNFAKWYDENYPVGEERYELDKDIKIEGNKVYSSDTCLFVTSSENRANALAKNYEFKSPDGHLVEIKNLTAFCRLNNLQQANMDAVSKGKRRSHKGWTAA